MTTPITAERTKRQIMKGCFDDRYLKITKWDALTVCPVLRMGGGRGGIGC